MSEQDATQRLHEWRQEIFEPALQKSHSPWVRRTTPAGISPDPLYAPEHGIPGQPPYLRGPYPTMYPGRLWTMRQYAGFGTAEATNQRFRYLLEKGQSGLSTAFDLPTQIGFDPGDPMASGEVGRVGVSISSLQDVAQLFHEIPMDRVSTSMTINSTASILLAMYVAVAQKQGVAASQLSGTVQNDILKEYAARGTYRFPPTQSMRLVTDVFSYTAQEMPRFNPISISGYHMREAGCTAVQEVGLTLAHGLAYIEAALQAGLEIDAFASRLSFFFAAHNDLFEEVAKFRAARRLWSRLVEERFQPKSHASMRLRFHTQTGGSTLTASQPDVNIVRVTVQALSAVLGGTQSLHTNSWDEALALPSQNSARLALRTQQVLAYESGVPRVVDPLGGCPFVEDLTDQIEHEARRLIEKIDELGGAVKAIEAGFVQQEIHRSALRAQQEIENQEVAVIGVNAFVDDSNATQPEFSLDETLETTRVQAIQRHKNSRNAAEASDALRRIEDAAVGQENLVPLFVAAVTAGVTLGEICQVLEQTFGSYRPRPVF